MQYKIILGVASAALVGASTFAMPQEPRAQGDKPMPRTTPASAPMKGGMACHKASDVIGTNIMNAQNDTVGEVEDLIIDPTSGRIDYAVISLDVKGAKDQWYAVPFSTLAMRMPNGEKGDMKKDRGEFTLNVDAAKMESAPGFSKDKWPDVNAPAWRTDVEKYYGSTKRMSDSSTSGDAKGQVRAIRASKLLDQNLVTTSNDKIGDIEELALDPQNARVSYVVVSSGGFLGMGDKMHAIPWAAVRASPGTGKDAPENLVVDVTKERLQKSPEFKKDEWARMSEPMWMNELYTYYGVSPYWSGKDTSGALEMPREKNGNPPTEKGDARKDSNVPR